MEVVTDTPKKHRVRPESLANLTTAWPAGVCGNPNGRPKGAKSISTILKQKLNEIAPDAVVSDETIKLFAKGTITNADAMAAVLYEKSLVGKDLNAWKELVDRVEGKVSQPIEVVNSDNAMLIEQLRAAMLALLQNGDVTPEALQNAAQTAKHWLIECDEADGLGLSARDKVDAIEAEVIASVEAELVK